MHCNTGTWNISKYLDRELLGDSFLQKRFPPEFYYCCHSHDGEACSYLTDFSTLED